MKKKMESVFSDVEPVGVIMDNKIDEGMDKVNARKIENAEKKLPALIKFLKEQEQKK